MSTSLLLEVVPELVANPVNFLREERNGEVLPLNQLCPRHTRGRDHGPSGP